MGRTQHGDTPLLARQVKLVWSHTPGAVLLKTCVKEWRAMPNGTIKKLVQDKGFGFIQTADGTDVFFHHSTVADQQFDNLTEGQKVEYTVEQGGGTPKGKGPRAASVKPL
jgi:CspA family cold shock protein